MTPVLIATLCWFIFHGDFAQAQTAAKANAAQTAPAAHAWEADIQAFEQADRKTPPPQGAVLFVGSSTIRKWTTVAQDFPKTPVINRGFGGSKIADSTYFADRIIVPYHPRIIVFYAGDNDLAAGKTPAQVFADYKAFVEHVRPKLPTTQIFFVSIKPSLAREKLMPQMREANTLIKDYSAHQAHLGYIDIVPVMLDSAGHPKRELFGPDGLHMNPAGYRLWTKAIAPYITGRH